MCILLAKRGHLVLAGPHTSTGGLCVEADHRETKVGRATPLVGSRCPIPRTGQSQRARGEISEPVCLTGSADLGSEPDLWRSEGRPQNLKPPSFSSHLLELQACRAR